MATDNKKEVVVGTKTYSILADKITYLDNFGGVVKILAEELANDAATAAKILAIEGQDVLAEKVSVATAPTKEPAKKDQTN